jgi:hypothetical protein
MSVTDSPARPVSYHRFSIGATVTGFEVVDEDGRSVSSSCDLWDDANEISDTLNRAAASGHRALARALGMID